MGFNRFTKNVLNISGLPDRVQNQASALKALFDQSGVDIKTALNELMTELESSTAASKIGADIPSVAEKTVQSILIAFEAEIANRYTKAETDTKVLTDTNNLIEDFDINLTTGVITITKKDGTVETFDTAIEKVPAKFEIVESGSSVFLKITNVDGTSTQTDITELMNVYEFVNSDDIAFTMTGTGNEKKVTANIRNNSIGIEKFSLSVITQFEGYVTSASNSEKEAKTYSEAAKTSKEQAASSASQATNQANNARSSATSASNSANTATTKASEASTSASLASSKAKTAESYAHGGTGTRQGEDTDNAKYYAQIAKEVAGGDFVTPVEMETYAQPLGTTPTFETTELSGQEIEVDAPLAMESVIQLSGNSEQDSRSGKNLYNYEDTKSVSSGIVVDDEGWITITGDNSASTSEIYMNYFSNKMGLLPNTIYNIICEIKNVSGSGTLLPISVGENAEFSANVRWEFDSLLNVPIKTLHYSTRTDLSNATIGLRTFAVFGAGKKGSITFRISVLADTTVTADTFKYEAFGVQPSPDYPSEIRSVKSKSDNLFDMSKITESKYLDETGNFNNSTASNITDYIELKKGEKYIFSYQYNTLISDAPRSCCYYDLEKNFLSEFKITSALKQHSIIPTTDCYIRITYDKNCTNIMLNKGDKALPYQPYGYVPVELKVEGKNLVYLEDKKTTANYEALTCSIKEQSITINGNSIGGNTIYLIGDENSENPIIKLEANQTYYLKMFYESGDVSNWSSDIQLRTPKANIINNTMNGWKNGFTYTPTENTDITWVRMYLGDYTFTNLKFKLQVSRVNLNEWVEPKPLKTISLPLGDIELRSTPDGTRDTFARVDGVWNKVSNIGSVIFDGSDDEAWGATSSHGVDVKRYDIKANSAKIPALNSSNFLYCNYYPCIKINGSYESVNYTCIALHPVNPAIVIFDERKLDLINFKIWLNSNNIEVVYPLSEPTYTPITDQALISALDELEQLILHKGYNYITATSVNGVKAQLDLFIPSTASVTEVVETESGLDMPIPVVPNIGDVKVKIPAKNKMTLNPTTGEVKINGEKVATEKYVKNAVEGIVVPNIQASTTDLEAGTSGLSTGNIYLVYE